jgi:small subunit ribosomal protein S18
MPVSGKICKICEEKIKEIDYKDVNLLRKFINPYGKIISKSRTGTCSKHQRLLAKAIKRARQLALLPYIEK